MLKGDSSLDGPGSIYEQSSIVDDDLYSNQE